MKIKLQDLVLLKSSAIRLKYLYQPLLTQGGVFMPTGDYRK